MDSVKTDLGSDEFMSKLALCYNVAIIKQDAGGKYGISFDKGKYGEGGSEPWALMANLNPLIFTGTRADIEGGGRILVKPKSGKYVVPNDADPNLIYVGFSKDGKTIKLDPTFAVSRYKVSYEGLESGAVKPASSSTLPGEKTYAEGATVTIEPNLTTTETTYNGKTGIWNFDGWEPKVLGTVAITGDNTKTFTMPAKDVVLVPKWTFTETVAKYTVEYDWGTVPSGVDPAPELPVDNKKYDTEEAAKAAADKLFTSGTAKNGVKDGKKGVWVFSGWTPYVEGQAVKFKGSWNFTANAPSVASVTITPSAVNLDVGDSHTFAAEVTGENLTDSTVIWGVEGATSADTRIDKNGKLIVGEDETAAIITVRVTSAQDNAKGDAATVIVTRKEDPGEENEQTPVDNIPIDTTGNGEADAYVEVEKKNSDGTYAGADGNKYFDPDGDGVFVKWLAPVFQDPPVKKVVSGKDADGTKDRFAFIIIGYDGAPMPAEIPGKTTSDKLGNTLAAVLYGEGEIEFGNIKFGVDIVPNKGDSKTFVYRLGELNTKNESYTYDTTKYNMTVTITNTGEELVKKVKYATATGKVVAEMKFTNLYKGHATISKDSEKPKNKDKIDSFVPNTGDATERTLYETLLLFAGVGITVVFLRKRGNEE